MTYVVDGGEVSAGPGDVVVMTAEEGGPGAETGLRLFA